MEPKSAYLILPGHSFDDFPTDQTEADADAILSAWTGLWHPQLIAQIGSVPEWKRVEELSGLDSAPSIFVVTNVAKTEFADSRNAKENHENFVVFSENLGRDDIVQQLLTAFDGETGGLDADVVADFYALGYCYLQIELLTKHMRYSSGVEESSFQETLVAAAHQAIQGELEDTKASLQSCFDLLTQEREHYYAVEVYLLDIALVVPQLRTVDIRSQIDSNQRNNLVLTGKTLDRITAENDELAVDLKASLQEEKTSILGGEFVELPTSLVGSESLLRSLNLGSAIYERVLEQRPAVFGRRRFGLAATMPQILNRFGFSSALHATMDDGRFPEATQSKSRWEGSDGSGIDAMMRAPMDGTKSLTFLKLASSISDSMDMDHVATKSFVHWAGRTSRWFEDLTRTTKYTNALGRFVTVAEYFEESYDSGMHETYLQSQYRSPYLAQAVQKDEPNPISRHVRYWRRQTKLTELLTVVFLTKTLGSPGEANPHGDPIQQLESTHFDMIESTNCDDDWHNSAEHELRAATDRLSRFLLGSDDTAEGCLIINPHSFTNRTLVTGIDTSSFPNDKPVYANERSTKHAIVDVPSMGFCWFPTTAGTTKSKAKAIVKIADERSLRNEFVEVEIDAKTGGLRNIRDYGGRGNRLSLQIARRLDSATRTEDDDAFSSLYTKMIAKEISVGENDSICGEIIVHGELVDGAQTTATFKQVFRLERGSRILRLSIELDPKDSLSSDPWNSYYAIRSAWQNEACDIYGSLQETRQKLTAKRFEAPLFVQIDDADRCTTLLTGGLAFHQRMGHRMLDTILIAKGETLRRFEVGIGVDLQNPFRESQRLMGEPITLKNLRGPNEPKTSWLFHIGARNVVTNSWTTVDEEKKAFVVRLAEVDGKATKVTLSAVRKIAQASKTDFLGQTLDHCEVHGNKITFKMHGHELAQIEVEFTD